MQRLYIYIGSYNGIEMKNGRSYLRAWLSLSVATFLVLVVIHVGLPALLLVLQVPSFEVGVGELWFINWKNDASGFGIEFNLVPLMIIAIIVGLVGVFIKFRFKR
jgi:hypothetical protein